MSQPGGPEAPADLLSRTPEPRPRLVVERRQRYHVTVRRQDRAVPRSSTSRIQTADDLGRAIRARRTELGLDQGALARLAGVSRQWIVEIEQGKARAEVGLLLRTLHALRLDVTLRPAKASQPAREVFAPGLVDLDALIRRARGQEP